MPERFVILGASSFYGRNFAECVQRHGDDVYCLSRPVYDLCTGQWGIRNGDYLVNFVSKSLVAESWDAPGDWCDTNLKAITERISFWKNFKWWKKFIHVSTPESYGHTESWVDESYSNWKPSTPYAVSRAAADMMLIAYHRAYGWPAIITRTANIYGPGQQPYRIIPHSLEQKRKGEAVLLHGGGDTIRSFIHVKDACEALYLICKEGSAGETYHISTNTAHSIKQLVEMIGVPTMDAPERIGKDRAYLLNSDKLRAMGWSDTTDLEKGLQECALSHSA